MDGLLGKIIEKVAEKASGGSSSSSGGGYSSYNQQPSQGYNSGPAPPQDLPYPWVARWDDRDQRWFYVNEQTGERSWERPYGGSGGGASYGERSYGQPQPSYGYEGGYAQPQQQEHKDHSMMYGAAAGAAGLVGGALLMHEGEKIHDRWDEDKDRIEQNVEDFPEDAARWTGEKVGEVEQIPENIEQSWDRTEDRIENKWDNAVDDVEDFPENAAEWTGRKVGEVEQFGDNMENAYDEGVVEGRDDCSQRLTWAAMSKSSLPLAGVRVVELAGLAPGPFAGLLLADYGASVLRVDRPNSIPADRLTRRKTSITLDLRDQASHRLLLSVLSKADVLIDPYRPGVLERLGLSPSEVLLKHNPRLTVARMTGFRRDGKYKDMAGHDINYIAVSGVLSMLGRSGEAPYAPGNILGDFGGGGAMCFLGILLALLARAHTGRGQVVEANMVDGSAYLATMPRLTRQTPLWNLPRGENMLDGGSPFYGTYECRDRGKYFAVGALEPQFYAALIKGLGFEPGELPARDDRANWPALRAAFERRFREKTRAEWEAIFDGTDACATPVLEQAELERSGYEQRPAVHLVDTPGLPIPADDGGWTGGGLLPGTGGQETLKAWMGWEKGRDFDIRADGVLVWIEGGKSKL
ncbi:uncharacterized protein CDV56_107149 [Aspergillus thermomutatus]|uniref:WW domain-containing protein n=1 Tax=Aspergillus thermomutatus TaxID=41047 RepID=A0A397H8G6_ASPTH|nr:uncharacterized protein CDV56_107149 [Aspergillus thermomutatus]RHZ56690.1 hypothetical protein CDV56_107149 [Aspergillus thermomutatus]